MLHLPLDFPAECLVFFQPSRYLQHGRVDLVHIVDQVSPVVFQKYLVNVFADHGDRGFVLFEVEQGVQFEDVDEAAQTQRKPILVL